MLDKTKKEDMDEIRLEEIKNMMNLNKQLIDNAWKTVRESAYYSRKDFYDSLDN